MDWFFVNNDVTIAFAIQGNSRRRMSLLTLVHVQLHIPVPIIPILLLQSERLRDTFLTWYLICQWYLYLGSCYCYLWCVWVFYNDVFEFLPHVIPKQSPRTSEAPGALAKSRPSCRRMCLVCHAIECNQELWMILDFLKLMIAVCMYFLAGQIEKIIVKNMVLTNLEASDPTRGRRTLRLTKLDLWLILWLCEPLWSNPIRFEAAST